MEEKSREQELSVREISLIRIGSGNLIMITSLVIR